MRIKILSILVFIFLFLIPADLILALGVGANVSSLDLEMKLRESGSVKISVFNISQEAGIFRVFPDELGDWIKISPDDFRLEAGESKEVKIDAFAKKTGIMATNLSILAEPLNRQGLSVGSGLKIPLRLNVNDKKTFFLASAFSAVSQIFPPLLFVVIFLSFFVIFSRLKSLMKNKVRK